MPNANIYCELQSHGVAEFWTDIKQRLNQGAGCDSEGNSVASLDD